MDVLTYSDARTKLREVMRPPRMFPPDLGSP